MMTEKKAPETVMTPIGNIRPYPKNAKKHGDDQVAKIAASIRAFGFNQPIVVDKDGVIIVGHGRFAAAMHLGLAEVPTITLKLSEEKTKAYRLADNKLNESEWDNPLAIEELRGMSIELAELTGFSLDALVPAANEADEEIPEPPKKPVSKVGDLYIMGEHRLLVGDSTKGEDAERLFAGRQADMAFTDPPWNVDYGGSSNPKYKGRTIMNDDMDDEDWQQFSNEIAAQLFLNMKKGAPLYLVMSAQEWPVVDGSLRAAGFHWSSTIIWAKDSLVISRKDYHTQYEPIWYGWKEGEARLVELEDRKQSDLWQIARPKKSEDHPTTKPLELVERAITNSSKRGDLVVDLFLGSGSTLIAAERTGRVCYGMELDPAYADVIVSRWERQTGRKAQKVEG